MTLNWYANDMALVSTQKVAYTRLCSRGNFLRRLGGESHKALDSVDMVKPFLLGQISTDVRK